MARTDPQLNLRLPAALKAQLEQSAKESNRTLTAETVARIESSFNVQDQSALIEAIARLNVELARKEMEIEKQKFLAAGFANQMRAAIRLLGRTQYAHDPNYEILVAQTEESVDERALNDSRDDNFDVAHKRYKAALEALEKVKIKPSADPIENAPTAKRITRTPKKP